MRLFLNSNEVVEQLGGPQQIVINNSNNNVNNNVNKNMSGGFCFPQKSKTVALVLAIFWGYLGAHRFYTGKVGTGII